MAKSGGPNRDIFKLSRTWYNIPDIRKEMTGSACIYIKPLQKNIHLQRKPVLTLFFMLSFFYRKVEIEKIGTFCIKFVKNLSCVV